MKEKILIVGDVHNEFGRLNDLINKKKPDMILACGDFGYWPKMPWAAPLSNIRLQTAKKLLWCDGNHEDFWSLKERSTDEMAPGIIYMPRGSTYELPDGRIIMFMGGADSIDKAARTEGQTWFREEIITQKDLMNLPDIKVDIFITHTCSEGIKDTMIKHNPYKKHDPSNFALTQLRNIYKPSLWFFGHWHHYEKGTFMETKWYCLGAAGFPTRWWMWLPD